MWLSKSFDDDFQSLAQQGAILGFSPFSPHTNFPLFFVHGRLWAAAQSEINLVNLSPIYHPRNRSTDDFEDIIIGAAAEEQDLDEDEDDEEPEDPMAKKWHHKLLKSASIGVLRGQESPSQCVNDADEAEDETPDAETILLSTSSASSPQPPNHVSLTNSLILAMTLILIMHAMIANLWNIFSLSFFYMVVMHIDVVDTKSSKVNVNKALSITAYYTTFATSLFISTPSSLPPHNNLFSDLGPFLF